MIMYLPRTMISLVYFARFQISIIIQNLPCSKLQGIIKLKWTRLSCHDFDDNQVLLQLFAMAYNIGNFLRRLALPKSINDWSLRTMREKLVKIEAKVVSHARYVTFQMAEVLVSRSLFYEILAKIHSLKPVPIGYD